MASAIVHQPSPSQFASAACHLERMSEWRYVRINGERYAVIPSGVSGHTYLCRADAAGCSCLGYVKTGRRCSHMLSLELDALEQELRESVPSLVSLRSEWPGCAAGCGNLVPASGLAFCDDCSAARARSERMAAARARVLAEWTA